MSQSTQNPPWIITPEELKASLGQVKLVDVREPEEYAESRIDGCTLIPLDEVSTRGEAELDKADDIVLYCAHGVRSMHALMALRMLGFEKLRSLEGGIAAWLEKYPQP
jgi:rhodanese-related sulfurtransferase